MSTVSTVLAVDLGKTGCRLALRVDGSEPLPAGGEGSPGLAADGGASLAAAAVLAPARRLLATAGADTVDLIGVGSAGAAAAPAAARELAARLADHLGAREVVVASDAVTSHAGALGAGPGVVLAAGTGAVAIGIGADGACVQVDGWGSWLGDDGSGAWIGRAGFAAALRAHDGRGPATLLVEAVIAAYGSNLGRLPGTLADGGHLGRRTAAFAPEVARAAGAGDPVARDIVDRAAASLAETVLAAAGRISVPSPVPVALTGGLLDLGAVLLDPLLTRLRAAAATGGPAVDLRAALGTSLDGAHLLATRADTVHEPGLVRVRDAGPAA